MGRSYVAEEEKDLTLPEDSIHRARLLEVKERSFDFRDRQTGEMKTAVNLEWWWEITRPMAGLDPEFAGRRVKGECRPKLTNRPGNRFREWAEAVLRRDIPVGMSIDLDDLIGMEADIVIGHRHDRKDPNKIWEEVTHVMAAQGFTDEPPF